MSLELRPRLGTIEGRVFPGADRKGKLFHAIEIPLEPFVHAGKQEVSTIHLEMIRFGTGRFAGHRSLAGKRFEYSGDAIDGSMYVADSHQRIDVTAIEFGEVTDGVLDASLALDATDADTIDGKRQLRVQLTILGIRISRDLAKGAKQFGKAREWLARFADAALYGDPEIETTWNEVRFPERTERVRD